MELRTQVQSNSHNYFVVIAVVVVQFCLSTIAKFINLTRSFD